MSAKLWSFEELVYYSKSEDPEVRYWAVERLVRDYAERAAGPIAILLLDDHDQTPNLVAEHLGRHGTPEHFSILTRAFRRMAGQTPALCFDALVHLGYPDAVGLARGALEKATLPSAAIAMVLESLSTIDSEAARALIRETLDRRVELLVEVPAFQALLRICDEDDYPKIVADLARALQWRGLGQAGELFRALTDDLETDDCGWCIRTGPDGRMDLKKTIRAIESSYDCEILMGSGTAPAEETGAGSRARQSLESALRAEGPRGLSQEVARDLTQRLRSGDPVAVETGLEAFIRTKAALVPRLPGDTLPDRIAAFASAIASPEHRPDADRLGPAYHQWVVGTLVSAAVKLARYRNYHLEVERAEDDLDALLLLLEEETAFLGGHLPAAIAKTAGDSPERAISACVRLLDSRGPFFPKVLALETLGLLRAEDHVPEILDFLADENSYIYSAAEKALAEIGDPLVPAVTARIQAEALDPDSAESVLMLLSGLGTRDAYEIAMSHVEFFLDEVGAGVAAEWLSLLGARELLEPLRKVLTRDPARVGQAVLLLGAIHNVRIPEEDQIRAAIEDFWRKQGGDGDGEDEGSGRYVM